MKLLYILLLIALSNGSSPFASDSQNSTIIVQKKPEQWIFEKVVGSFLKFKNGLEFDTHLHQLKFIGMIPKGGNTPYLICSGRDCDECDANISIYIYYPLNKHLKVENGENNYSFPGTERDYGNKRIVYTARAFYGEILPGIQGVIWYQKQLMENNAYKSSIFLVNLSNGIKKETTLKDANKLKLTLDLLKRGSCAEIKGLNYLSEP